VRKHFYLVTEHEEDRRVGCVSIMDQRMSKPLKNEEGRITVLNEEKEDFEHVGKKVGLGYADFENEDDYEARVDDVIKEKLADVDKDWLEKAGLDAEEVLA